MPAARTASAGVILALAAAALSLPGCGGSSGAEDGAARSTATSARTASADAPQPSTQSGGSDAPSPQARGSDEAPKGEGSGQGSPPTAPPKGEREHAPTPAETTSATIADMTLVSPSLPTANGLAAIPASYTCDGTDSWPALRWAGVPAGTEELALYVMNAQPIGGRLFIDWAVAGLDPGLESIAAGKLPAGAVVGTNSFGRRGYSICPPDGAETYIFALFALPRALSPQAGFDPHALREEILGVSGNVGLLTAIYAPG